MKQLVSNTTDNVTATNESAPSPATRLLDGKTQSLFKSSGVVQSKDTLVVGAVDGATSDAMVVNTNAKRSTITGIHHLSSSDQTATSTYLLNAVVESSAIVIAVGTYVTWGDSDGGVIAAAAGLPEKMVYHAIGTDLKIYDITRATPSLFRTVDLTGHTIQGVSKHGEDGIIAIATTTALVKYDAINNSITEFTTGTSPAIINNDVNYTDLLVQSIAETDTTTGLKVVTLLAGTAAGGTWIVGSIATHATGAIDIISCSIKKSGRTVWAATDKLYIFNAITSDTLVSAFIFDTAGTSSPHISGTINNVSIDEEDIIAVGTSDGIFEIDYSFISADIGVQQITTSINTGMMRSDCRLAALSSTVAETITSIDTDTDHTVNGNDLSVTGSIVKSAAALGSEQMKYSGLSSANYLYSASSDFNFGTSDFFISMWVNFKSLTDCFLFSKYDSANNFIQAFYDDTSDRLSFQQRETGDSTNSLNSTSDLIIADEWQYIVFARVSGELRIYINGTEDATVSSAFGGDISITANFEIGNGSFATSSEITEMSGFHVTLDTVSSAKVADDYLRELQLLNPGTRSVLQGSSSNVVSVAQDEQGGQDYAATPDKTTVFYKGAVSRVVEGSPLTSDNHISISSTYGIYGIATGEEAAVYDINSSIAVDENALTTTESNAFLLKLNEVLEQYDKYSVFLESRSGAQMYAGILHTSDAYGWPNGQANDSNAPESISVDYPMANGSDWVHDKGELKSFNMSVKMDIEDAVTFMQLNRVHGRQNQGWHLIESRQDTIVFGRVYNAQQTFNVHSDKDLITFNLREAK